MRASSLALSLLVPASLSLAACGGAEADTRTTPEPLQCSLPASCQAADTECLGAVDNAGRSRFGLRISQLDVTRPAGLTAGLAGVVVADDVLPANVACDLPGRGTFSWLLRFDLAAGTLETGGARPVNDVAQGYAFAREEQGGFALAPATLAITMGEDGSFATTSASDLVLPMYVDPAGFAVILPLRGVRFTSGALSASRNCVGRYDLAALDPADGCLPTSERPAFRTGGSITGSIRLEDADRVLLPAFSETLCAHLAGDDGVYVERNATGTRVCKRDGAGRVLFPGDTCGTPGEACADAVAVAADFAASSVLVHE